MSGANRTSRGIRPGEVINWSKWESAKEGDFRSPCPVLNALANHHILPHDGREIAQYQVFQAITMGLRLDFEVASRLVGTTIKELEKDQGRNGIETFNLDELNKHGLIEHDASLSRDDAALGDNHKFNPVIFNTYLDHFGDATETSLASASAARYSRVVTARSEHQLMNKEFTYGLKEYILSLGETVLLLAVLGDPKEGKVPLQYLKVLFREERLPYNEGWRPIEGTITQSDIDHMIFSLIETNEDKGTKEVGVLIATVDALKDAVRNTLLSYCTIM